MAKCSQPLPIRWSRTLPKKCEPSTVTVKLDASGRWFVFLLVEDHAVKRLPQVEKVVGVDAGITSLIATSDGEKIANPKHFKRLRRKLRQAQKALSCKVKGSNNREKTREQVARIHAQVADAQKDFLHKLTTRLVRENQTITVEDLAVKNMIKNHKLAQAIANASVNAANNVLAAGLAVNVCGANVRPDGHKSKGQLRKTSDGESGAVLEFLQVKQPANPKGRKQKPKS